MDTLIERARAWLKYNGHKEDGASLVSDLLAVVERQEQLVADQRHLLVCYRTHKRPSEAVLDRMSEYNAAAERARAEQKGGGA